MRVNLHALSALGMLSGAAYGSVTSYTARVPVSGDAHGDISRSITTVAEQLTSQGWTARTRAIQTGTGWFSGANVFGEMEVTVGKKGAPFSTTEAEVAIQKASNAIGLKIAIIGDWIVNVTSFVAEAPATALSDKGLSQTSDAFRDAIDKAGKFTWMAVPTWAWIVGGGAVGLFALAKVASLAKAVRR